MGVYYGIREFFSHPEDVKELGLTGGVAGKTLVIQGLGNVGSYTGIISQNEGDAIIVGVAELEGTVHDPKGIDIDKLIKYRKEHGTILGFPGTKTLEDPKAWVSIKCDVLIPAALESQIHRDNAKQVKAKVIVEAANGPVTAEAEEITAPVQDLMHSLSIIGQNGDWADYHFAQELITRLLEEDLYPDAREAIIGLGVTFSMEVARVLSPCSNQMGSEV